MHGYGEFKWTNGRLYIGYFVNDRKEGFGIHYWQENNRIYVGFWKGGKQEGIGRYISANYEKWGYWKKGTRVSWFNSEDEAFSHLLKNQIKYKSLLLTTKDDIMSHFEQLNF
jgi:hypothetical protein